MKSIIPLIAITILAALALTGCGQGASDNSTSMQNTNSSVVDTNGMNGVSTNLPVTNSVPSVNTNLPAGTNQ